MSDNGDLPPGGDQPNDDRPAEEQPKDEPQAVEHLNIKVTDSNNEVYFKIKKTTNFKKLMEVFCERQGKDIRTVRFLFDGDRVNPTDNPETVSGVACDCGFIDVYRSVWKMATLSRCIKNRLVDELVIVGCEHVHYHANRRHNLRAVRSRIRRFTDRAYSPRKLRRHVKSRHSRIQDSCVTLTHHPKSTPLPLQFPLRLSSWPQSACLARSWLVHVLRYRIVFGPLCVPT